MTFPHHERAKVNLPGVLRLIQLYIKYIRRDPESLVVRAPTVPTEYFVLFTRVCVHFGS